MKRGRKPITRISQKGQHCAYCKILLKADNASYNGRKSVKGIRQFSSHCKNCNKDRVFKDGLKTLTENEIQEKMNRFKQLVTLCRQHLKEEVA